MDFDTFRAQWSDPEFRKSILGESREPTSVVIERARRRVAREKRWRQVRRFIPRAALAALLGLVIMQIFVTDSAKLSLQSVALLLGLVVVSGLNLVDRAREKYLDPKLWLNIREFLVDEYHRIGRNIYYDQWTSALLGAAIFCLALYFAPVLSAGARMFGWAAAGAAALGIQAYYRREFYYMRLSQVDLLAEVDSQLHNE